MDKDVEKKLDELVKSEVSKAVDQYVAGYRIRLRYFAGGFGGFVLLLIAVGLFGGGDIFRALHDLAFPSSNIASIGSDFPAISYEASFELRGDPPELQSSVINFFAPKGKKVEVYAQLIQRFPNRSEQSPVVISIDGKPITNQSYFEFLGGFHDLSDKIDWDRSFEGEKDVHSIQFSLDDTKMRRDSWVTVFCVVLVKHRESNE